MRGQRMYYDRIRQLGYMLPTYKASLVSRDYLDGCRARSYYCPMAEDLIKVKYVPNCPPKHVMLGFFKKAVRDKTVQSRFTKNRIIQMKNLIEIMDEGKMPDCPWFVLLLSHVHPECKMFQRDYVYERVKNVHKDDIDFDNEDGL